MGFFKKTPTQDVLCGFDKKPCIGAQCMFYTYLRGTDSNTGKEIDEPGCAIAWLPVLMVETSKEVRQGAAATESFRNVVHESILTLQNAVRRPVNRRLSGSKGRH